MIDLGVTPLCESFLAPTQLGAMEPFYPLRVLVCDRCNLVQQTTEVPPETIFSEYAYFSSYSDSWVSQARRYAETMTQRLGLGKESLVVELGSNDGYMLRHFVAAGVRVLGIEPAANVAEAAERVGVTTLVRFFDLAVAQALVADGSRADLIACNNTLAQVPRINDFVAGMALLLASDGLATIEVPHLLRLLEGNQFDTIYHEHFSYFSLLSLMRILGAHGLAVVDVEELQSHGGSLRVYARHEGAATASSRVTRVLAAERIAGLSDIESYGPFRERVERLKWSLLEFLIAARRAGKAVAGYGAPGKANTLLNYCGIGPDLLGYTVDRNPYKHGRYTPGTRIPILHPDAITTKKPDYVWILPWNLRREIVGQLEAVREWGGRYLVAIPALEVID